MIKVVISKITSVFPVDRLNRIQQNRDDIVHSNNLLDRNGISVVLSNHLADHLGMDIDFCL